MENLSVEAGGVYRNHCVLWEKTYEDTDVVLWHYICLRNK
jgi:hypothetical protein